MKVYDAANVRNVALVGHSGSGKTQLAAALLFDAGAVNRFGKVDDGTTVTDSDEEEISRKHTLSASLAWCEWNRTKVNLIDTPGMANFLSDARAALRVADAAVVVIDAVAGAEVQTEKVWHEAEALGLPKLVVLNRLDRERSSVERALASVREACSRIVTPIHIPIGEERGFSGVVDLVTMKAYTYATDGSGKPSEGDVPASMADTRHHRPRSAHRDGRGGRRCADGAVLRGGNADAGGARHRSAQGSAHRQDRAARVRLRAHEHRHPARPRRHRQLSAVPRRTAVPGAGRHDARGDHARDIALSAVRRVRLEDGGRPLRRTHHALPRDDRHAQGRFDCVQRDAGDARAARTSLGDAGQDRHERAGTARGRPGRRRKAEGHPHERHAGGAGRRG